MTDYRQLRHNVELAKARVVWYTIGAVFGWAMGFVLGVSV